MKFQRGGFMMGLIVGLIIGLGVALGVALYITKTPVPFIDKVPQRPAEQDAKEAEKNKNWDPNGLLYGKNPAKPHEVDPAAANNAASSSESSEGPPPPPMSSSEGEVLSTQQAPSAAVAPPSPSSKKSPTPAPVIRRDPMDILEDRPSPAKISESAATKAPASPFTYFVQAGAFTHVEEADQQRAKLAMLGFAAKVTDHGQAGRTMYRVRIGPFNSKDEAGGIKKKLESSGVESVLVPVQH